MDKKRLHTSLLAWYETHKRPLPWRADADPYKVWLSEIILQQTRVVQGLPYYKRFVEHYPTIERLAAASEEEVLYLWQGLGYYSRARNLHKCSQEVVQRYQGRFPSTYSELITLPGIGPYTAAAIASIAFQESVAVVDGNVYRVLARLLGIDKDITTPAGQKLFRQIAAELVPKERPGEYNQALMELGALQCVPQNPACTSCPLQKECVAYQRGLQQLLPVKKKKTKVKDRYFHYLVLSDQDRLYLHKRRKKDIWHGLYEFHLIETEKKKKSLSELDDPLVHLLSKEGVHMGKSSFCTQHRLSHQLLHISFYQVEVKNELLLKNKSLLAQASLQPYSPAALEKLPLPRVIQRFFEGQTGRGPSPPFLRF